jgi:hypothetical protein
MVKHTKDEKKKKKKGTGKKMIFFFFDVPSIDKAYTNNMSLKNQQQINNKQIQIVRNNDDNHSDNHRTGLKAKGETSTAFCFFVATGNDVWNGETCDIVNV